MTDIPEELSAFDPQLLESMLTVCDNSFPQGPFPIAADQEVLEALMEHGYARHQEFESGRDVTGTVRQTYTKCFLTSKGLALKKYLLQRKIDLDPDYGYH